MAVQSSVFVVFLAGASVAGATAGFHRDAILDKVTDAIQPPQASPISAMTRAPSVSIPPLQTSADGDRIGQVVVEKASWIVPAGPVLSKPVVPVSDTQPVGTESQSGTPRMSPLKAADLEGMPPIELMKSAAKERQMPKPSQLDLILSALPLSEREKEQGAGDAEATLNPHPELAPDGPVEQAVPAGVAKINSAPVLRPQTPSSTQKTSAEEPTYSAKHYHTLRHHLSGQRHLKSKIACIAELQLIASYTQIYFDSGSSSLDDRGASAARQIAAKAQSCPKAHVSIVGFTDPGGTKEVNQRVSWSRANGVFRAIKDAGFSMDNIEVSSHMEDHPDFCVHYEGIDRRVVFDVREKIDR